MSDNNRPGRDDNVPRYGTPEYAEWYARRLQDQYPAARAVPSAPPRARKRSVKVVVLAAGVVVAVAIGIIIGAVTKDGGPVKNGRGVGASTEAATTPSPQSVRKTSTASATNQATATPSSPSSSPAETFASIYAREHSGVVRIDVVGCSDSGVGTGFLLSPTLIATVNHVVAGAVVVGLTDQEQRTTGQVIGSDPVHDLALVRAARPLTGYHFHIASAAPRIGDPVAAIGFPIGGPITLTQGGISGLNRDIDVDGHTETGMVETDAALNPGNSGGPLLDNTGTVIGLVDAGDTEANGIAYAVPGDQAASDMQAWEQTPQPQSAAACQNPLGPSQTTPDLPTITGLTPDASAGISQAFATYFDGINTGDYAAAYNIFSPNLRSRESLESFIAGDSSSYDFDATVIDAQQSSPQTASVALTFTSLQAPEKGPDGDACDNWTISYRMLKDTDGTWYIDGTAPYGSSTHTSC